MRCDFDSTSTKGVAIEIVGRGGLTLLFRFGAMLGEGDIFRGDRRACGI